MAMIPLKRTEDPIKDFFGFDDALKRLTLFPTVNKTLAEFGNVWYPSMDVSEDERSLYVRVDLPGLKREDIHLSMENDTLIIKGERKIEEEKKGKNHHIVERGYGSFQRSIQLGVGVDEAKISAKYKDGVLEVVLPKTAKEAEKKINIDLG
ncbi:MAG TPA: Hsp20/alpha crystallin family protein [Candidatus Omnitrophota bacterium]|nr:Hsp20/alpha crystallin family protein [Candidatus Omnitrophota bacterium]HQL41495.1 Hsp20/alpha crystallin family protein [Candidatus Omnitrophota bacterium]